MKGTLETKYLAILRYKKGHNSSKNCRKIVIIELDLDIHKIHLHATPSFNLTFHSQVIIWKPNGRTDDTHFYSPLRRSVGGQEVQY